MNPSATLITQNPFFTIVTWVKVYLLAIQTERFFLILDHTLVAELIWIKRSIFIIDWFWWVIFSFWTNFIYAVFGLVSILWRVWLVWLALSLFLYLVSFIGSLCKCGCFFLKSFWIGIGRVRNFSVERLWTLVNHLCSAVNEFYMVHSKLSLPDVQVNIKFEYKKWNSNDFTIVICSKSIVQIAKHL